MTSDPYCRKAHGEEIDVPKARVTTGGGIADVFVYVKKGVSGVYAPPSRPVTLDQQGCEYVPHVFGLVVGQPLEVLNSDDTLHNVHAVAETNESFNLGMPLKGTRYTRRFEHPEVMVKVKCDVHGWMHAYAGILPHPFFAVTDENGSFRIGDLPAATYELEAWHETFGTRAGSVTLADRESKTLTFTFQTAE
jgi:plastocyanin